MYDGRTGEKLRGAVFIGPCNYLRLKHEVADKIHARGRGKVNALSRQAVAGRSNGGGGRWGEMERDACLGYSAPHVLNDRLLVASDDYEANVCMDCGLVGTHKYVEGTGDICCHCGGSIGRLRMPYSSKQMLMELMSMGIKPSLNTKTK
jgi:DNA-directed RNA polymerase beta subunit